MAYTMEFTLTINLDNAEAQDAPYGDYCVPDYLARVAETVRDGFRSGVVIDGNGNTIGKFQITGYK
jgi:hypothetical protein